MISGQVSFSIHRRLLVSLALKKEEKKKRKKIAHVLCCFIEIAFFSPLRVWSGNNPRPHGNVDIHLRKLHRMYCPELAGMKGNDQADRLMVKSYHKKLA